MQCKKPVSNERLLESYARLGNVWRVAEEVGIAGQTVHRRLQKLGAQKAMRVFTQQEEEILNNEYLQYRAAGQLEALAARLGRTKQFICRQARRLGLTSCNAPKIYSRVWKGLDEETARAWWEKFKTSHLPLGRWCEENGIDDLGFSRSMQEHFPDEWEHVLEVKSTADTPYRTGRKVEYAVRFDLISRGYPIVMRSAQSKGPADLVAIKTGAILLVQCKKELAFPTREWNVLLSLATSIAAIPVLAGQPSGKQIVYYKLTGRKTGGKSRQPMCEFSP